MDVPLTVYEVTASGFSPDSLHLTKRSPSYEPIVMTLALVDVKVACAKAVLWMNSTKKRAPRNALLVMLIVYLLRVQPLKIY